MDQGIELQEWWQNEEAFPFGRKEAMGGENE